MKIERFEDLLAWQEARKLTAEVYQLSRQEGLHNDRTLVRQMRSSAISVMANIAEGFSRYSFKDSKQFFTTSRGSLAELRSHAYVAVDQGYISEDDAAMLQKQMEIVGKLVSGLIRNSRFQLERDEPSSQRTIEPLSAFSQ